MNLSFDLQLFTTTSITIDSGVSWDGNKTYTLTKVTLKDTLTDGTVGSFFRDTTQKSGLKGWTGTSTTAIAAFKGADNVTPVQATLAGGSSYTWEVSSADLNKIQLGEKTKLNLIKTASAGTSISLAALGGQTINFDGSNLQVNLASTDTADKDIDGTVAITGGKSVVSILGGSTVTGATVSGSAGEVISLQSGDGNFGKLNLKGSDSEAVITVGGSSASTVESSSLVGFSKITFTRKGSNAGAVLIDGVKDSAVSILGSSVADTVSIGSSVSRSAVSIDGGKGNDLVTLSGTGAEVVIMSVKGSDGNGADDIKNWVESTGDTDKGNVLSIKGGMSSLLVGTVSGGAAQVGMDSTSGATLSDTEATTIKSSNGTKDVLGLNVNANGDVYSALLFGKDEIASTQGIKFDNYNYLIADSNKTLDLGAGTKKTIVLANTEDEKHWGDTAVYENVVTIESAVDKSFIINGVENASVSVVAGGKNASIWGGNNGVEDVISVKSGTDSNVFSGYNDGLDVVEKYVFGDTTSKANAIRFLDGIGYVAAEKEALVFGADGSNGVSVSLSGAIAGDKVAYGFGTEGDKYVAAVDATDTGKGQITYESDVNVYIGQGDNSFISVGSGAKDVKLGWDGGAGYVSIGGIDAAMAADGAVVVGTTDNAQSIAGSSRGASSISGGFVADKWTDENADTLVGGGVATKTTTFFVGENMGKDEIQNLSSKDNIVFLGSKYEDLVKFAPETTDNTLTFKFSNGNTIEASLVSGKTMKGLTDVSLYFDDGTYVWNGTKFAKAE